MIKNHIGLDIENSRGKNNNCAVCFKDRGSFTFQGRQHIQINKAEKGATLRWYCPLADPQSSNTTNYFKEDTTFRESGIRGKRQKRT